MPMPSVYYAQPLHEETILTTPIESILDPQPKIITAETYKAEDDSKYDSVAGMISQQKS